MKSDTIVNGFRKAGVYPLNREEVLGRLPANSTTKKKTITTSQKATPEDRIQRLEKELIFFKVQLSAHQEREKEKEPEPKKRRIQTEAIVLSQEEVITELARVDNEKREKVELAKQKKEELEQKRVAAAEAKALKKEQLRLAKAENFSLKGEKLGDTVADPGKFHQKNVETFLNQLRQLGDLEDMPPVTAWVLKLNLFTNLLHVSVFKQLYDGQPIDDVILNHYMPTDMKEFYVPVKTVGDGNCLYNAVSIILTGNEKLTTELRMRAAIYMVDNQVHSFLSYLCLGDSGQLRLC